MAKIKQLSPFVADLIAAGEVVERPASVVKELMENSIDAGATQITIEIKNGGMSYIRVTDNGIGMSPDDASVAFLRHATSKLRDASDLEAIGTLGFRGEALAAISAVSKIELITKENQAEAGTKIKVTAGKVESQEPTGCPDGTTFTVCDLFYNTPARLKFIKNDRAEGSAVSAVVIRTALSHPEVSIKYIKDEKEECHTPGDGRIESCIYSLLGRDFAQGLLPAAGENEKVKVSGYVSSPSAVRGNRTRQFFFVNGRFIKSKTLQAALERAYANCLFTGKYPACILYIEIPFGSVDVNVHPTKTEVKFSDEGVVFSAVHGAVLYALENEARNRSDEGQNEGLSHDGPISGAVYSRPAFSSSSGELKDNSAGYGYGRQGIYVPRSWDTFGGHRTLGTYRSFIDVKNDGGFSGEDISTVDYTSYQTKLSMPETNKGKYDGFVNNSYENSGEDYTIIGECLNTYIIVERGQDLILIDKHAAHERVLFDSLKNSHADTMEQFTLSPIICDMSSEDMSILLDNEESLAELGFEIDQFSDRAIAVRRLPADMDTGEVKPLLDEICQQLSYGDRASLEEKKDEILHSIACKAAIKAGRKSEPEELLGLVKKVLSDEVKYCPHGRPVSITFTKSDLDKQFRRA